MLVTKGDSTGTLASHQYDSGWLDDGIILGMVAGTGHPTTSPMVAQNQSVDNRLMSQR